jgi:hypothetical protein
MLPFQNQEAKLFVGNLPPDITSEELQYVFSNYGTVSKLHVMDSTRSKSGQSCAFVSYSTPEAAAVAIRTLNNVYRIRADAQEAISVSVAKGHGQTEGSAIAAALVAAASAQTVGIAGLGATAVPGLDLSAQLQPMLTAAPGLLQAPALTAPAMGAPGLTAPGLPTAGLEIPLDLASLGLGIPQAPLDLASLSAHGLDPVAQQAAAAATLAATQAASQIPLVSGIPSLGQPALGGTPVLTAGGGCKLFIGDLPGDIAREALVAVFSTYGAVLDVHVMTGKSRSGAACALVEYSSLHEAQTAIATLHQKYEIRPGSGMITVRYFEGTKGKGKGGDAATAPAAATDAGTNPASLRFTPY